MTSRCHQGITDNLSKKILQEAQAQQKEVQAEQAGEASSLIDAAVDLSGRGLVAAAKKQKAQDSDDDSDDFSDTESQWDMEEVEITEEDEKALEKFMVRPRGGMPRYF